MVINPESIEFDSIENAGAFIQYQPGTNIGKESGFVLADNLMNQKGGILYPKGMEMDLDRLKRLQKIHENNPDWQLSISIQKNPNLVKTLQTRIFGEFQKLIDAKKNKQEYRKLFERIEKLLETYEEDVFEPADLIYALYQSWFTESSTSEDTRTPYFRHLLNTFLFSIGIVHQAQQYLGLKFSREEYIMLGKIALLRNITGIEGLVFSKNKKLEELHNLYIQGNKNSSVVTTRLQMHPDVIQAVKLCSDYDSGNREMIGKDDPASKFANIVIIADHFDIQITGLFGTADPPQKATDKMYVEAQNKAFVKAYVDALAKGLRFGQLFDFYYEIDRLNNACTFGRGKFGCSYPMTGFKSPVIYVCSGHMVKCPYYVGNTKSVTIFKKIGALEEGAYGRCELLSDQLIKFYETFYDQIKEETQTRPDSNKE